MTYTPTHFLKESDYTPQQWTDLIDSAAVLKTEKAIGTDSPRLYGKHLAMIFEKTSTRTRSAFEVAAKDQGMFTTYFDPSSSQLGHKESIADTARVLSGMYDIIEYRGGDHAKVEELAQYSDIPVVNGLTDDWHPTQMLADSLTIAEYRGYQPLPSGPAPTTGLPPSGELYPAPSVKLPGATVAYLGDARFNMGRSWMMNAALTGMDLRIIAPESLCPPADVAAQAQEIAGGTGAKLTVTDSLDALEGVEFVYTDIWVSMGEPEEAWAERIDLLRPYRVDDALLARTGREDVKFMHCLPAFHDRKTKIGEELYQRYGLDGVEVSNEVFESSRSIVFPEAANRMPTIKAVLLAVGM